MLHLGNLLLWQRALPAALLQTRHLGVLKDPWRGVPREGRDSL